MTDIAWPQLDALHDVVSIGLYVPRRTEFAVALEQSSINPGQPLRTACYVTGPPSARGDFPFRTATATFIVEGLTLTEVSFPIDPRASLVRWPPVGSLSLQPAPADAATFWHAGEKALDVEIDLTDPDGAHDNLTRSVAFTVIREVVDSNLWQWISPPPPEGSANWKAPYLVAGYGRNVSARASLTGRVELWEQEFGYPLRSPRREPVPKRTANITIPPLQTSAINFDVITQNWDWLTPIIWTITGDTMKTFRYQAKMTVSDEYGNEYSIASEPADIIVRVSESKFQLGKAATLAAASAAVIAVAAAAAFVGIITAISVPILSGAALAAYGAAAAFGAAALDPPEPDPRFRERVPIPKPADPPEADSELAGFMRSTTDCLAVLSAVGLIVGKLLGASQAGDEVAVKLQRDDRASAIEELDRRMGIFQSRISPATSELSDMTNDPAFLKAAAEWRQTAPPQEVSDAIMKAMAGAPDLAELALSLLEKFALDSKIRASSVTGAIAVAIDHTSHIARTL